MSQLNISLITDFLKLSSKIAKLSYSIGWLIGTHKYRFSIYQMLISIFVILKRQDQLNMSLKALCIFD